MASDQDIRHQLLIVEDYRERLAVYLRQKAKLGSTYTRPDIENGITETREGIKRAKSILLSWGVKVEAHPDDEEELNLPPHSAATAPAKPGQLGGIHQGGSRNVNVVGDLHQSPIHIGDTISQITPGEPEPQVWRVSSKPVQLFAWRIRPGWLVFIGSLTLLFGMYLNFAIVFSYDTQLPPPFVPLVFLFFIALGGLMLAGGLLFLVEKVYNILGLTFEKANDGIIHLSQIEGSCPKCTSKLRLRTVEKDQKKQLKLVCQRNPGQHQWPFDFTKLPPL